MAKQEEKGNPALNTAAETVGRLAGKVKARVDAFAADHPDPIAEMKDAVAEGRERLAALMNAARPYAESAASAVGTAIDRGRAAVSRAATPPAKPAKPAARKTRRAAKTAKKAKPAAKPATKRAAARKPARVRTAAKKARRRR